MANEIARYTFNSYEAREAAYNNLRYEFRYGYTTDRSGNEYYIIINDDIKDATLAGKICNASGGIIYDRGGGGGCYITTATLQATNQKDDGLILSTFRQYRDNWVLKQTYGESLVKDYYQFAPMILANIDEKENAKSIYQDIYDNYLFECYQLIKESKYNEAFEKYKYAVLELKAKYL